MEALNLLQSREEKDKAEGFQSVSNDLTEKIYNFVYNNNAHISTFTYILTIL